MSAKNRPSRGRARTPTATARTRAADADRKLLASLEARGVIRRGPEAGEPFPEDLLTPGPACPGAVDTLLADRR